MYEINISRGSTSGQLTFRSGNVIVNTPCWWDPNVIVLANPLGYPCWATRMATKIDRVTGLKRPGFWFGKGIKYGDGTKTSDAIFIHEGNNSDWSDGCIVCAREHVIKMWDAIQPKGEANVLVKITDAGTA